jgi:hypothetical protein
VKKTFKVATPKFRMPKATKLGVARIKVNSFVSSPKEMERKAASFGRQAEGRIAKFNKGRV